MRLFFEMRVSRDFVLNEVDKRAEKSPSGDIEKRRIDEQGGCKKNWSLSQWDSKDHEDSEKDQFIQRKTSIWTTIEVD